jgi:Flp pilus assembly protein TadG
MIKIILTIKRLIVRSRLKRGQSLVEFALILPLLLLMFGFLFDVGRIIDTKILLQSATHEGARQIISKSNMDNQVLSAISDYSDRLEFDKLTVISSASDTIKQNYTYHALKSDGYNFDQLSSYYTYFDATVTLKYELPIIMPNSKLFFGENFEITSSFTSQVYLDGYQG